MKVDSAEYEGFPLWERILANKSKNALAIPLSLFILVSFATSPFSQYSPKGIVLKRDCRIEFLFKKLIS